MRYFLKIGLKEWHTETRGSGGFSRILNKLTWHRLHDKSFPAIEKTFPHQTDLSQFFPSVKFFSKM